MVQKSDKESRVPAKVSSSLCYNHSMLISEAGEFGLISEITRLVNRAGQKKSQCHTELIIGIGDDAAAWKRVDGIELATTDILIEGIHFDSSAISWHDLGWKAIAVNLSDVAAMGGQPCYALISLALPAYHSVENVLAMYRGMLEICNRYGLSIVGGNISNADNLSITVAMTGTCERHPMMRSTAAAGDMIAVTGYPGLAAAGLQIASSKIRLSSAARKLFYNAHFHPVPQIETGLKLSVLGVKAAIDISDGLLADLRHICEASRKSAVVYAESLPCHPLLKHYFPRDYLRLILSGGEDYILLFTADYDLIQKARSRVSLPITIIGEITPSKTGKITILDRQGKAIEASSVGWDHYRH